jgi:hypothetical protein
LPTSKRQGCNLNTQIAAAWYTRDLVNGVEKAKVQNEVVDREQEEIDKLKTRSELR